MSIPARVTFSFFCSALEMAERTSFSSGWENFLLLTARMFSASSTPLPRIWSATSRAFCGTDPVALELRAETSISALDLLVTRAWPVNFRVGANSPSRWPTMFSVTNTGTNSLPLCTWKVSPTNSGVIIERRDQVLMTCLLPLASDFSTLLLQTRVDEGPLLERARHYFFPRRLTMNGLLPRLLGARLVALGRLAPRRTGVTAAGRTALAAAHRVIDRVHRDAAHVRALAEPTRAPRLADRLVLVFGVADLADRGHAADVDHAHLAARQAQRGVVALARHQLGAGAGRAHELRALARLHLDAVDDRAERDVREREAALPGAISASGPAETRSPTRRSCGARM